MLLVFLMMVCFSCTLALHQPWRRRDGQSIGVMRRCNGDEQLCRISYDKVCYVLIFHGAFKCLTAVLSFFSKPCIFKVAYGTAHNAYSSLDDKFSMPNNFRSLDAALAQGVRALMLGDISASYTCGALSLSR